MLNGKKAICSIIDFGNKAGEYDAIRCKTDNFFLKYLLHKVNRLKSDWLKKWQTSKKFPPKGGNFYRLNCYSKLKVILLFCYDLDWETRYTQHPSKDEQ